MTTLDLEEEDNVSPGGVALDRRRLIVRTDETVVVLDETGAVVTTVELDAPLHQSPVASHPSQRCVVLVSEAGTATVLDVESGETLGAVDGALVVNAVSLDGCTASITRRDDFALLRDGDEVRLDRDRVVVAISPDGGQVVVRDRDGQAWLRGLDGRGDVELGRRPDARFAFVDR